MSTAPVTSGPDAPEPLLELIDADRETPALVSPEDGVAISYAALRRSALDLGERLRSAGAGSGDRVAVVLPNGPEIVQVLLAIAAIGAAAAPLNPAYTEPEYRFYLEDLAPQLLVVGAGAAGTARAAAPALPVVEITAAANGGGLRAELNGRELPRTAGPSGGAEDIALLLHTSGTTSRPKQVPLLQRNLTSQARSIARHYLLEPGDVSYCAMPLFHVHGLVASTLAQLAAGGAVVIAAPVQPPPLLGPGRGARRQLALRRADAAPDDPRPSGHRRRRRFASPARAAQRSRPSSCARPRPATACR